MFDFVRAFECLLLLSPSIATDAQMQDRFDALLGFGLDYRLSLAQLLLQRGRN
jgi:hypothetical protein